MKPIVLTNNSRCVGCNKCLRACPVSSANVVLNDAPGRIRVSIDQTKCIACGVCISACSHGARGYRDDLNAFVRDLEAGKRISVVAAPSVRTSFPDYRKLFRWLKSLGVERIIDGSTGYSLFEWAAASYIRRFRPYSAIISHCPVVVDYIRTCRPELLNRLVPVASPLSLQGILLKGGLGEGHALAALTPCIAATREFPESGGAISYNVTFQKLQDRFRRAAPQLPPEEGGGGDGGPGPGPGGDAEDIMPNPMTLQDCITRRIGPDVRVDGLRGKELYGLLDEYLSSSPDETPQVLTAANCAPYCDMGPAASRDGRYFQTLSIRFSDFRRDEERAAEAEERFAAWDEELDLERFLVDRKPLGKPRELVPEEDVNAAFRLLGKAPDDSRHFDCGFCGCESCLEMARKVALHTNIPMNCVTKMRQVSDDSNRKITAYIDLIRNVSENLLNRAAGEVSASVEHALLALCYAMDAFSASLWKNTYDREERPSCARVATFPAMLLTHNFNVVTMDDPPGWLEALVEGNPVIRSKSAMTSSEQQKFLGRNVNSLVLSPILAQGDFWGFISLLRQDDAPLTDQDLSVVSVCSNLLASFMLNIDLKGSFLAMDEINSLG
ncbi:MAG: 4Fe-4S dicluster domain-containing protein [Deltaproteobacteria bacterium]|jgi:ferredoxin|nr:4Fe-4S dicluster domain-containing protein [Deltaproteobacteria bacterium]